MVRLQHDRDYRQAYSFMEHAPMYKENDRRLEIQWLGHFEKHHKTKDTNRFP
jgi:hypothetical protein